MSDRLSHSSSLEGRPLRIGHFEVVRSISSTPMMDTCVVQDGDATRILRLMAPWLSADVVFRTSFERMSAAFVGLDHPNLGRSYEFGIIENRLYTLGEHIVAPSLRSMNHTLKARATLTPPTIRRIALELCAGLHAVHTLTYTDGEPIRLLYRDPFAGYIFFERNGRVILREPGPWAMGWLNHKRFVVHDRSTSPYRAPEDLRGEELDVSSDLYALARTLLIMRAPTPLHAPPQRVSQQLDEALTQLQCEAPNFAAVLRKATHPKREERYASAKEMAADIEPLTKDELDMSSAEARQFLEETQSPYQKRPDELSSSLQNIAKIQRREHEPTPKHPPSVSARRRTQTIDLPLDALPDLKTLRDKAALNRARMDAVKNPPRPFDEPPPTGSSQNSAKQDLHYEVHTPTGAAPPAQRPAGPQLSPLHARSPDPRVQTLAQGVRTLIHRPDAALLRDAAQDRLSGNPARALEKLSRLGNDVAPDIHTAARVERGFSLLELRQHAESVRTLTPCLAHITNKEDQSLIRYYLGLATLSLGDHSGAREHFNAIPEELLSRFPDIPALLTTLK